MVKSMFVNRRGLHSVTPVRSRRQASVVDDLEVEVRVDDGWVRGCLHARRRVDGRWEALVDYPDALGRVTRRWFSHRHLRAVHEPES